MPKEIFSKTLKYYYAFGPAGFYDKDVDRLSAWATSIQILDFKLKHSEEFLDNYVRKRVVEMDPADHINEEYYTNLVKNEELDRNQALFDELLSVTAKVKEVFVPYGRPGRHPKLFAEL